MICRQCDGVIKEHEDYVKCTNCGTDMHFDCKQQCNKCGAALCDRCAKETKWKCVSCKKETEITMEFISATMFESYLKCPFAFKHEHILKTLDESERDNKWSVTGNLLHDLFEKYAPVRPLPSISDLILEYVKGFDQLPSELFDDEEDRQNFRKRDIEIIMNWLQEEELKNKPLFVEKQHFISIHPDLPKVRVTIDRINGVMGDVENWEVEDYKTGAVYNSEKLRNNMQLPIYAMAIKQEYGALPKTLKLYFPQHQKYRTFDRVSDDLYMCKVERGGLYTISISQRLEQMVEIYNKIKAGDFQPNIKNTHFCQNFCTLGKKEMCDGLNTKWDILKKRGY